MAVMKTETLTLKCTPQEKEKIRELAYKKNTTVSKLLHAIIFELALKEDK